MSDEQQATTKQDEEKEQEQQQKEAKLNPKIEFITKLLNKTMKVKITDGRTLIGTFLCTDNSANIILGSCLEYVNFDSPGIDKEFPCFFI